MKLNIKASIKPFLMQTLFYKDVNCFINFVKRNRRLKEEKHLLKSKFVKTVKIFYLFSFVRYIILHVFDLSYQQRVLWFDVLSLYGLEKKTNICGSLIVALSIYLFSMLYTEYIKQIDTIIHSIIVNKKVSYFLVPVYKKTPIHNYLMSVIEKCLNQIRLFIFSLGMSLYNCKNFMILIY